MCDVKRRKKAAGSLSKQMSTGQRWEGGKQSAIIYSWLFTRDRAIQVEGLITWPDLRSTVTDHCQSLLLPHSTLNCCLKNIRTVIRSQARNPSGFLINITILNWSLTSCHYHIIADNEVEVTFSLIHFLWPICFCPSWWKQQMDNLSHYRHQILLNWKEKAQWWLRHNKKLFVGWMMDVKYWLDCPDFFSFYLTEITFRNNRVQYPLLCYLSPKQRIGCYWLFQASILNTLLNLNFLSASSFLVILWWWKALNTATPINLSSEAWTRI